MPLGLEMNMDVLESAFAKMGARIKYDIARPRRWGGQRVPADLALDVRQDRRGEYFLVSRVPGSVTELVVLDVQPKERHLVLMSRNANEKHRYLLGHDERHWFVAGIPESTPVSRVRDAKAALKPDAVLLAEQGLRSRNRDRRSNVARIRQGEWFFVPARTVLVDEWKILRWRKEADGPGQRQQKWGSE
jgi:hypothetical protein